MAVPAHSNTHARLQELTLWTHEPATSAADCILNYDLADLQQLPDDKIFEISLAVPHTGTSTNDHLSSTAANHANATNNIAPQTSVPSPFPSLAPSTFSASAQSRQNSLTSAKTFVVSPSDVTTDIKKRTPNLQVSVSQALGSALNTGTRSLVRIRAVRKLDHVADYIVLYFRDQYISRSDMWNVALELQHQCVWVGKKVTLSTGIRAEVRQVLRNGQPLFSGFVSPDTKPIFRSESARYLIFLQMSSEMWDFEDDGELFYNKAIDGFLPDLFKHWKTIRAHHLVSIILVTRVNYRGIVGAFCLPRNPESRGNRHMLEEIEHEAARPEYLKDFYKVVVDNVSSDNWEATLTELKRELHGFRRDVMLRKMSGQRDIEEGVISGYLSSAMEGNLLETINLAAHQFNRDFIDRDLLRTGTSIIIVTAGTGIFEVDEKLLHLTGENLLGNSMGIDIVSLSKRPLHITPILRFRKRRPEHQQYQSDKNASLIRRPDADYEYIVPFFCEVSYFGSGEQLFIIKDDAKFESRCKMHELQMMGVMEDEMSAIAIEQLKVGTTGSSIAKDDLERLAQDYDDSCFADDHTSWQQEPPTVPGALTQLTRRHHNRQRTHDLYGTSVPDDGSNASFQGLYEAARGTRRMSSHHSVGGSSGRSGSLSPRESLKMSPINRRALPEITVRHQQSPAVRPPLGARRPTLGRQFSAASTKLLTLKAQPSIASMTSAVTISSALTQSHLPIVTKGFILPNVDNRASEPLKTVAIPIREHEGSYAERSSPVIRRRLLNVDDELSKDRAVSVSLEDRERGRSRQLDRIGVLTNVSKKDIATSPEPATEDPMPWRVLRNPCHPRQNDTAWNTRAWRWAFISSMNRRTGAINWESLCAPAAMPLLAYNPVDLSDLESDHWTENSYGIYLDMESVALTLDGLLHEMVGQRLNHGFQIASVSSPYDRRGHNPGDTHDRTIYLTHADKEIHSLRKDPGASTIEVRKYIRKRSVPQPLDYRCLIWQIAAEDGYEDSRVLMRSMPTTHNWNFVDQIISGAELTLTESVRYWRARFVLVPAELTKERRQAHQSSAPKDETFTDEEIRLAGVNKILELVYRQQYFTPAERKALPRTTMTRQRITSPDINFTTFDPSVYVAQELMASDSASVRAVTGSDQATRSREHSKAERIQDETPLSVIASEMQGPKGITIKDRLWHWRWHENCWVGSDFVSWLLAAAELESREEATRLAQRLMERGLFEHVKANHAFLDGFYLYRLRAEHASRTTRSKSWFSSAAGNSRRVTPTPPSIPATPAPKPSPSTGRARASSNVSSAGLMSPSLRPQKLRRRFEMSKFIRVDIDPHKRSTRPEYVNLHYDAVHRPGNALHLRLEWISVTAKLVDEIVQSWSRTAEKYGLALVEMPVEEAAAVTTSNPFRKPLSVKLAVNPPLVLMSDPLDLSGDGNAQAAETLENISLEFWMARILRKFDFILDREADGKFPKGVELVWSFGKSTFRYSQFVHKSGMAICQITPDGFLWLTNRLFVSRVAGSALLSQLPSPVRRTGSINAAAPDLLRNQFLEWCTYPEQLTQWYEEQVVVLEQERLEHQSGGAKAQEAAAAAAAALASAVTAYGTTSPAIISSATPSGSGQATTNSGSRFGSSLLPATPSIPFLEASALAPGPGLTSDLLSPTSVGTPGARLPLAAADLTRSASALGVLDDAAERMTIDSVHLPESLSASLAKLSRTQHDRQSTSSQPMSRASSISVKPSTPRPPSDPHNDSELDKTPRKHPQQAT
ncbi:vacuolar membrane-associated protein iml1 [Savitreella phatthalungensis]